MSLEPVLANFPARIEELGILQKLINSQTYVAGGDSRKDMAKLFHIFENVDRSDGDWTMRGETQTDCRTG